MNANISVPWRLAKRELRSGLSGFAVFLACLTLGVGAIAAVGVINASVLETLKRDSAALLGGELKIESTNIPLAQDELVELIPEGSIRANIIRTNAMAEVQNGRRLAVALKIVDNAYPLFGKVDLEPLDRPFQSALTDRGAVVEQGVLSRLDIEVGDAMRIGDETFHIRAVVLREPDRIGGFIGVGPRVFIHVDHLEATGVIQPGSLARYSYNADLPQGLDAAVHIAEIEARYPEPSWQASDVRDVQPRITRVTDRLASYLTIAGLASLLIGGIGVALAVQNYLAAKTRTIATLKCLGASGRVVFRVYLFQVLVLTSIGILLGLVLGQGLPWIARWLTEGLLPIQITLGFYPLPLAIAAACGLLTALSFAIWPLARAGEISPASMFRALLSTQQNRLPLRSWIFLASSVLGLAALAIVGVADRLLALIFIGVAIGAAILLTLIARWLLGMVSRLGTKGPAFWRMAIANLHRPGAQSQSVVVALGAGLAVLTVIVILNRNLGAELQQNLDTVMPGMFFIDIQPDQRSAFKTAIDEVDGARLVQMQPIIRGRVVRIDGVPAHQSGIQHWTLQRDRALSYTAKPPVANTLVEGAWWPEDYNGPPLVSIEDEVAAAYVVGLGDKIGFNVLGRVIEAEIASIRPEIDWSEGRLDFVFLFSPGVLEGAPHSFAAAAEASQSAEANIFDALAEQLPNVTPISMREVGDRIAGVMSKVRLAILAVASITLMSGLLVLAGAVAAARRRHLYEAAVLKVLGARRFDLLRLFAIEYLGIGLIAALTGGVIGIAAAFAVVIWVMELPWIFPLFSILSIIALALALTAIAGFAGTWRLLGRAAGPTLRST